MSIICHIDGTVHESREALHKHIRPLMKQEAYYLTYERRVDLFTGEDIPFKNVDQYLSQEFLDKTNLRKWLARDKERGRKWAINWLLKRKEQKGLVYAPSQVELRSLECPSMPYYDHIGGYYSICHDLGFKDRFQSIPDIIATSMSGFEIIIDTREQKPLKFVARTTSSKLDYGDYALAAPHDKGVYIERKSLDDFVGTLNQRVNIRENKKKADTLHTNLERFDRELARATEAGHYIVMLVESNISDALEFDTLPWMRHGRASPAHVFKNLRDMLVKYPLSFQAVFVNGRQESARVALKILQMGNQARKLDLQYAYEKERL